LCLKLIDEIIDSRVTSASPFDAPCSLTVAGCHDSTIFSSSKCLNVDFKLVDFLILSQKVILLFMLVRIKKNAICKSSLFIIHFKRCFKPKKNSVFKPKKDICYH
ncbi:metallo-beta-lactamase domain protein, partial [Striga asiatica]